jgi:hypothetical protein
MHVASVYQELEDAVFLCVWEGIDVCGKACNMLLEVTYYLLVWLEKLDKF